MKPNIILTSSEARIVECIAVDSLSARETSDKLCVIYQCVANHLQTIYDKLGIKRNLQALTKWYYTIGDGSTFNVSTMGRRVGAAIFLGLFSFEVFNTSFECRELRSPRRGRELRVEEFIEN